MIEIKFSANENIRHILEYVKYVNNWTEEDTQQIIEILLKKGFECFVDDQVKAI